MDGNERLCELTGFYPLISVVVLWGHRAQNGMPQEAQLFEAATLALWRTTFLYEAPVISPFHAKGGPFRMCGPQ